MEIKIIFNESNNLFEAINKDDKLIAADADYCRLFGVLTDDFKIKHHDIII